MNAQTRWYPSQALLRIMYSDDGRFFLKYHAEVTGDAAAKVSHWEMYATSFASQLQQRSLTALCCAGRAGRRGAA